MMLPPTVRNVVLEVWQDTHQRQALQTFEICVDKRWDKYEKEFALNTEHKAAITQIVVNPDSQIPMVGASGAIAGVLGLYMMRFPNARVHVFAFIIIFFTTFRVPAIIVLGFWFFNQLTNGMGALGLDTTGGVAWFAHIGGFITGVILNQAFKIIKII